MTRGAIHAVDENLFWVEGEWPEWPAGSLPGSAVLRSDDRLYLIDTGAGLHHRAAIQAIAASCSRPAQLVLVNSGQHPGLVGNNDLLDRIPADGRRHLELHQTFSSDFAGMPYEVANPARDDAVLTYADAPEEPGEVSAWVKRVLGEYPPVRPTSVASSDLSTCSDTPLLPVSSTPWTGWHLGDDLIAVQATTRTARLAFYLPAQRTLLLPDELALTPLWPGSAVEDVIRLGTDVLDLLEVGMIDGVGLGFGPPDDVESAREAIERLVDRARTVQVSKPPRPRSEDR